MCTHKQLIYYIMLYQCKYYEVLFHFSERQFPRFHFQRTPQTCYEQVDLQISHHHQGSKKTKKKKKKKEKNALQIRIDTRTIIRMKWNKQLQHRVPRWLFQTRSFPRILNSCTWLPPWRWQGYKPTGWCRSSGFPAESIHMLLTRCLICSELTDLQTVTTELSPRKRFKET